MNNVIFLRFVIVIFIGITLYFLVGKFSFWTNIPFHNQFCIHKFAFFLLESPILKLYPCHLTWISPELEPFTWTFPCLYTLPSPCLTCLGCSQPEDISSFAVTPSGVVLSLSACWWRMKVDASALKPHPATTLLM